MPDKQPSRRAFLTATGSLTAGALIGTAPAKAAAERAKTFAPRAALTVDAAHPTHEVPSSLYGIFFEEINFAGDGGLYAELLRNRGFNENPDQPEHWSLARSGSAKAAMQLDPNTPLNEAHPQSLRVAIDRLGPKDRLSIANTGYWGIPVRPHSTYTARVWAKATPGFDKPLTLTVESADQQQVYAQATIDTLSTEWALYTVQMSVDPAHQPTDNTQFAIQVTAPEHAREHNVRDGIADGQRFWLGYVSLFPPTWEDKPHGFRVDLMHKLNKLEPAFLRFPGGNYLEGQTLDTHFPWKQTLGPPWTRPGHQNTAWGYWSDDGLGLFEYFTLAEQLRAQPLLDVWAGYSLNETHVPQHDFDWVVKQAIDETEFAIGDAHTKWGSVRAELGHPEPFDMNYVEIGNESFFDPTGSYEWRYARIYDAIKARWPQLKIVASAKVESRPTDVLDEHFYETPEFFMNNAHRYDDAPRNGTKIFVGEYGVTSEGNPTGTLDGAVGEAAFMTGLERNSDKVVMASYAPLFVNVNGQQWPTNLIGFDTLTSYGSPSYYVQQMFSRNTGDVILPTSHTRDDSLAFVASRDTDTSTLYLKVVNPQASSAQIHIKIEGAQSIAPTGTQTVLTGDPDATNSLTQPNRIAPTTHKLNGLGASFTHTFPAHSVTVLRLHTEQQRL